MIDDDSYFISLLFYMGMLTVDEQYQFQLKLRIPNYSVKVQYWEYLTKYVLTTSPDITVESRPLHDAIYALAMKGDVRQFVAYISKNAFSKLSDHDLQRFDEKYIQVLMLAYLFMSNIYIPMSEYEAVPGRADIFLQRNPRYPEIRCEWVFEIKYCRTSARVSEITNKRNKGLDQLKEYLQSSRIKNRPGLKGVLLVFTGKNKFEITEINKGKGNYTARGLKL
jgi:hypothetical protein